MHAGLHASLHTRGMDAMPCCASPSSSIGLQAHFIISMIWRQFPRVPIATACSVSHDAPLRSSPPSCHSQIAPNRCLSASNCHITFPPPRRSVTHSHSRTFIAPHVCVQVRRWFEDTLIEAQRGDVKQQALLAQMYAEGYGCQKDLQAAAAWAEKARLRGYKMKGVSGNLILSHAGHLPRCYSMLQVHSAW